MYQIFQQSIVLTILTLVVMSAASAQSTVTSDVSICTFPVPSSLKQANANFSISYTFSVDKDGAPYNIAKIQDAYIGKLPVASCISDWRIVGLSESEKLVTVFKWQHGKGWVSISIAGTNFSQVIRIKNGLGY